MIVYDRMTHWVPQVSLLRPGCVLLHTVTALVWEIRCRARDFGPTRGSERLEHFTSGAYKATAPDAAFPQEKTHFAEFLLYSVEVTML